MHIQFEIPGHRVQFDGLLETDGSLLRGEWWIAPMTDVNRAAEEGDEAEDDWVSSEDEPFEETRGWFELRRC